LCNAEGSEEWFKLKFLFCLSDMMWKSQQQLKQVLVETIQVLCKSSLPSESSFCIEATIGITLSTDQVMVISFKERIKSDGSHLSLMIADEQTPSKSMNDEFTNHSHLPFPHSSGNRNRSSRDLVSTSPRVDDQRDILQTYSKSDELDGHIDIHDVGVIDSEAMASFMPQFGDTETSVGDQFRLPSVDICTDTQIHDHDNDAKDDDIVVLKVEDGNDSAHAVNGMPPVDTEDFAAAPVQPLLYARKQKQHPGVSRARFYGNNEHCSLTLPTTVSFVSDDMQQQYINSPHQNGADFNVSWPYFHFL